MSIGLFSGCVNDTYDTPQFGDCVAPGLTKTKEVAQIYAVAINPVPDPITGIPNTPTYTADDIIEAYVISSDEGGNFYKSMYFQPLDGSKGFNLSIDESNLYTKNYQPGKKVFLKLKGLAFGNPNNRFARGLVFGAPPTEQYDVNRLPTLQYPKHLIASCDIVSEENIVRKITLDQVDDTYLNTLVEIDNVQFTGEVVGEAYDSNRKDEYDSSVFITDGIKNLTIRTSRYANFASRKVPSGKGKIRGVLTRYNSTYQIILRTERDVNMPTQRIDYHLPLGGTSVEYLSSLAENFESYPTSSTSSIFPKYINDAYKGGKYWNVASYSSNKYIQMSAYAFNSGGTNVAYLAIPITLTPGKKLSFKTKDGFYNGEVLKVYYSTDYIPGEDFSKATLVDITARFTIAKGTESGYASNFTSSGSYTIPSNLTGNGFFIFEYNTAGRPNVTTTIQIDDIIVN